MNIKNKRNLTTILVTLFSVGLATGMAISINYIKNYNDSNSGSKKQGGSIYLSNQKNPEINYPEIANESSVNEIYKNAALESSKDMLVEDFDSIFTSEDKLHTSSHERNEKKQKIINLIKSNIKGKHHVEAKKLIKESMVSLKPLNRLIKIELNLSEIKQGALKKTYIINGFKSNEQMTKEDIASVKKYLENIKGLSIKSSKEIKPMNNELIFDFTNWEKLKLKGMAPFDSKGTIIHFRHSGIKKDGILTLENRIVKNGQNAKANLNVSITGIGQAKKELKQLKKNVKMLTNQFLRMGFSTNDAVSINSYLKNAKSINPNSFLEYKNKSTPLAPSIFGFKEPPNIPQGLEVKYVPHTFTQILDGQVTISINIMHSSKVIRTIDLNIKGFKGLF